MLVRLDTFYFGLGCSKKRLYTFFCFLGVFWKASPMCPGMSDCWRCGDAWAKALESDCSAHSEWRVGHKQVTYWSLMVGSERNAGNSGGVLGFAVVASFPALEICDLWYACTLVHKLIRAFTPRNLFLTYCCNLKVSEKKLLWITSERLCY